MDTIDKINALLKERGMNGAELSRAIGVSSAVYSQWNTRKTAPSNRSIAKVAAVLGVHVSDLTGEAQKEKPPAQGGEPMDPETQELIDFAKTASADELRAALGFTRLIVKQRGK